MSLNIWTRAFDDCLSGCGDGTFNLVAIPADQNCSEIPDLSQVSDLYITPTGATDAFDYTGGDPTAVVGGIDNTVTDNSKTKWLVGKGGVDDPELVTYAAAKGNIVIAERRYRLIFELPVRSAAVRNLLLQLQCNWKDFNFRFGTIGGNLFGGENGISPSSVNAFLPLASGDDDYEIGRIEIGYRTKNGDPDRHPNPLA